MSSLGEIRGVLGSSDEIIISKSFLPSEISLPQRIWGMHAGSLKPRDWTLCNVPVQFVLLIQLVISPVHSCTEFYLVVNRFAWNCRLLCSLDICKPQDICKQRDKARGNCIYIDIYKCKSFLQLCSHLELHRFNIGCC